MSKLNDAPAGNEFVNDNSVGEDQNIVDGTVNQEAYNFNEGMGETGEAQIHDEEYVKPPEANPADQAEKAALEAAQTGKDALTDQQTQPPANEEYAKIKGEYEKLQKDMTDIQEFFKREEVRKALDPLIKQQNGQPAAAPAPTVSLDLESFSEAEKADPVSFMNAFGKRAGTMIESRATEIASKMTNDAFNKILTALEPMIKDFQTNKQAAIRNEFTKDHPQEAPIYLNPTTPQYAALKAELEANPTLTLEKAFLIARGKFAGQDAKEQADLIVKNREKLGIPSTSGKVPTSSVRHFKTSREAAEAAFNQT